MAPRTPTVDGDLQRLLGQAVERTRIGVDDGKSGSPVERLRLADGRTVVVKRVRPYGDWIMRAMHDEDLPGLTPLADRYTVLGPTLTVRERDGADGVPKLVARGWDRFAERVAPD